MNTEQLARANETNGSGPGNNGRAPSTAIGCTAKAKELYDSIPPCTGN